MLGSPCSPCCGCNPQDVAVIYEAIRSKQCAVGFSHSLQWQQAASRFDLWQTPRPSWPQTSAASTGSTGVSVSLGVDSLGNQITFPPGWCESDATVPQFGIYLGEFESLPQYEVRNGRFYYTGTNVELIPSVSGTLGHTCKVGQTLYGIDTYIPFSSQWYRWNAKGTAADRSCQRQLNELQNAVVTFFKQASTPNEELLALNPAGTALGSSGAVVSFVKYTTDWDVTATVIIGGAAQGSTQYPNTNCHVRAGIQVVGRFLRGTANVASLPTSTVQPAYTAQQLRGLLPWIGVPGCKAWVNAPYYTTTSPAPWLPPTDTSPFADLQPWWDYHVSPQAVTYNASEGVASYTGSSQSASFDGGVAFSAASFSRTASQALRWNEYAGGGSPLWRKNWTFSDSLVNPNESNTCSWAFAGSSVASDRQYSASDPGHISSATLVLS